MTEFKDQTCMNCKYRFYDVDGMPCIACSIRNGLPKWMPQDNEVELSQR